MPHKVQNPQFERCCFYLPLRKGIIAWSYFRLILDLAAGFTIMTTLLPNNTMPEFVTFLMMCFFADAAFVASHIIGGHKKHLRLLKFSIFYNILWCTVILSIVGYLTYVIFGCTWCRLQDTFIRFLQVFTPGFGIVCVQIYVILLTRSEITKLQNQDLMEMKLSKKADADAHCMRTGENDVA